MKDSKKIWSIVFRYILIALILIPGFDLLYSAFLPLTKYPIFYFLDLFFNPILLGNFIFIGEKSIEIVGACIGGSAYYLLLTLNLVTPNIKTSKRIKMILIGFFSFFVLNLIRIAILSVMYLDNSPLFDITHKILWYFGSTILILFIWFFQVKHYKINDTPFYSDLKNLYKKSVMKK